MFSPFDYGLQLPQILTTSRPSVEPHRTSSSRSGEQYLTDLVGELPAESDPGW